jgi:hypothetical protein
MAGKVVKVGKGGFRGGDNAVLQKAVDAAAAAGGGTVELPAGRFEMADALHLRSSVSVVGQGPDTVLHKVPSVSSPICDWLGYGHYEVTVESPDLFRPGMGVAVVDDRTGGFFTTTGTIVGKEGHALFINKMLNADYHPTRNARVVSIFPLVSAEGVRDVTLADLMLDGSGEPVTMNGCRGGAVFLLQAHTATVRGVEVANYNGDGVSFQQCTDVVVRGCRLHGCTGGGVHPGSGSVRYLIAGNDIHDNGGDGIFYCLRTTHSLCEGNAIRSNGRHGISIGERDTDHLILRNVVQANGAEAVLFREVRHHGGDRVVLEANAFCGNCTREGSSEVAIAPGIRSVLLRGNAFEQLKGKAVSVGEGATDVRLTGNCVEGRPCGKECIADPSGVAAVVEVAQTLAVGPAAAGPASALHLGVKLPARPANFDL